MKASAVLVLGAGAEDAATRAADDVLDGLGGAAPALAAVFCSPHYASDVEDSLKTFRAALGRCR